MIKEIMGVDFEKETSEGFYIVDVYGTHCGPCKMLAQTLDFMAFDYPFLNILKICSDENREFCKQHKIMGVPTILFVVDGEIKRREVGALPEESLMAIAGEYLY